MRYNERGSPVSVITVIFGVPQGSVLGPILFVAIVQHQGFKMNVFADDLQIYGSTAQNGVADLQT